MFGNPRKDSFLWEIYICYYYFSLGLILENVHAPVSPRGRGWGGFGIAQGGGTAMRIPNPQNFYVRHVHLPLSESAFEVSL